MLTKRIIILSAALAAAGTSFADDVQIRSTRSGAAVTTERSLAEGKALVNVVDSQKEPVLGLTTRDFEVARGAEAANVVSVEPIDRTVEVPRHLVLVLDDSYSMEERGAVKKVLDDVGAVVKTVRPIDDVKMVVFNDKKTVTMGGRPVHVDVFKSNKPSELQDFAARSYAKKRVTDNTFLYEAEFAGVELLREAPASEPRFLWVFSDGEDLNSAFKGDVVAKAAQGVGNFRSLATDYMPGPKVDESLAKFASLNRGEARKAGANGDLLALFEKSATRTDHRYAVAWAFPPPPAKVAPPAPSPKVMTFDAALFDFNKATLKPEGKEKIKAYREQARAEMSHADKVKITGYTDNVGSSDYNKKLSVKRAEAVRDYLVSLGADANKMEIAGEGMANPIADNATAAGRAKNRRVEVEMSGLAR
jgi:OOP family OmpA-OmpF porin